MAKCTVAILSSSAVLARALELIADKAGYAAKVCADVSGEFPIYVIDLPRPFDTGLSLERCIFLYSGTEKTVRGAGYTLKKPFDHADFVYMLDAVYENICIEASEGIIVCGSDLVYMDKSVPLTGREMELYKFLSENTGELLSREDILRTVWGKSNTKTNVVDVYVNYLRSKLKRICDRELIEAKRNFGYRFLPPNGIVQN